MLLYPYGISTLLVSSLIKQALCLMQGRLCLQCFIPKFSMVLNTSRHACIRLQLPRLEPQEKLSIHGL